MDAAGELTRDDAMLERVCNGAAPEFRLWRCQTPTVVVGRSGAMEREADLGACRRLGVAVIRRASGGGTVWIGPGTLQWSFALPHDHAPELATIPGAKRYCNRFLIAALAGVGIEGVAEASNGDLVRGDRKVGGIALRRKRLGGLVHGTLLCAADLDAIAVCLRHPPREPAYRAARPHTAFLANLGSFDAAALEHAVRRELAAAT